jgi:hypothetical protein
MKTALYGRIVFGASAVLFGVIALMWYDSDTWQTLRQIWSLPFGTIIGGCLMTAQIAGGIGMQYPRTARLASVVLGVVYLLFSLACIPGIIAASTIYAQYGSFFEQFSLLCGAIALYAATEASEARAVVFGRLARLGLGVCAISFTLSQIFYLRQVDFAQPDVLGDTRDDRVCTRGDCHSHQSPGTACDTSDDAHAGTLWRGGLDSAPDRSPRGASELVRIRPDFPYYRGRLDGG